MLLLPHALVWMEYTAPECNCAVLSLVCVSCCCRQARHTWCGARKGPADRMRKRSCTGR